MDLAADDGRVRRRAAPRPGRVAALVAVLPGHTTNSRIRGHLRLVEPARAVPLGGAWLPDAVSAAGRGDRSPAGSAGDPAHAIGHCALRGSRVGGGCDPGTVRLAA